MTSGPSRHVVRERGDSNAQRLTPLPVFGTGSSSGRITPWICCVEPSVGFAPTASSLPRTRSSRLSYKGRCLAGTTRTCDLRLRRAVLWVLLSYGEVASTAGLEPAFSGFVDRRLDPFGHVDMSSTRRMGAVDGICTRDLRLDRPVLPLAELRRHGARPGPRTQCCPG